MHEGPELSTTPSVPAQRVPARDDPPTLPPVEPAVGSGAEAPAIAEPVPTGPEQTGSDQADPDRSVAGPKVRGAKWPSRALLAGSAALGVLVAGLVFFKPGGAPEAAAHAAPSAQPAPSASPATPSGQVAAALRRRPPRW